MAPALELDHAVEVDLVLGSMTVCCDAYQAVHASLIARLAEAEAQRDSASTTDAA
jgi:hypothetical protein